MATAVRREAGRWIKPLARSGYAARAVVYGIVGLLALAAAFGTGGATVGSQGALRSLLGAPFGRALLVLIALGLLGYAVWRILSGVKDADARGSDAKGLTIRLGYVVSGIVHLGLAYAALTIAFPEIAPLGGGGGGSSGGDSASDWTAQLMRQPYGRWLVGGVGIAVMGGGIAQFVQAFTAEFERYLDMRGRRDWIRAVARCGISARGITLCIVGVFFLVAAWQSDPAEARGLGGALATLQQQSYGWVLLGLVAAGLVAFAVYGFVQARYRRIPILYV